MNDRMFDSPVFVKNGNSLIQEIACLEDALEFLYEWPKPRRTPIYQTAVRACQNAFQGDYPLAFAKSAFEGFARSAKVLEDLAAPPPWMTPRNSGHGGRVA